MFGRLLYAVAASVCFNVAAAVFEDDAWNVDYHMALLGNPQEHTSFFHQPFAGSKASLLYTLSESAVLGAVNPKDGAVVWRQQLQPRVNTSSTLLRAGEGQDTVISAVDGDLTAWGASDGRLAWTIDLGNEVVQDLEILELGDGKEGTPSKDALILSSDSHPTLRRVDGSTGAIKWTFRDESGDSAYQLSASATEVLYIALHTSLLGGSKIRVTSLDPTNGKKTDQITLSSDSEISSSADVLAVGANTASPIIAWTDKSNSVLKVNILGSKSISSFNIPQPSGQTVEKVTLHAPYHTTARPHFLVHFQTAEQHWAEIYHVDVKKSSVSKAYSLPKVAGRGAFSTSSSDANVYFTRISESEVSVVSSASHGILARWPIKTSGGLALTGATAPVHSVSEVSVRADSVSAARSAVLLSSGDWILIRDGTISWHRPEALAETLTAVWAYPLIDSEIVSELEKEAHASVIQAYAHRVNRHLHALQALPAYTAKIPGLLLQSIGIGSSDSAASSHHNNFGYNKLVVCATKSGRLIALDAGRSGSIVWNVRASIVQPGDEWSNPELVARPDGTILLRSADGGPSAVLSANTGSQVPSGSDQDEGTYKTGAEYLYDVRSTEIVGRRTDSVSKLPLWRFAAGTDESIIKVTPRPVEDPVASIGKVLGDRKVLYKYLNPNMLMITTISDSTRSASINIIDSVSGAAIYSTTHRGVDLTVPIASTLSENWFAYSFGVHSAGDNTKGYQLVVGEMYESPIPDDRGPGVSAQNSSSRIFDFKPYVIAQTYNIPEPISHMGVTQTGQGITSRQLLATLPHSGAVVGIPRHVIDPRRPVARDPTALEASEGLVRYVPLLEFDSQWYLSHRRELLGIEQITTSPAVLESTSLVFAYGLDIFGTRTSPSFSFDVLGKDFNKIQMLATVAALAVGTLVVAPLVRRKQINGRWQFS